ncbi:MAG: hypothetical protein Rhims3KO_00540 [Hyphomicrobiales bacterium]
MAKIQIKGYIMKRCIITTIAGQIDGMGLEAMCFHEGDKIPPHPTALPGTMDEDGVGGLNFRWSLRHGRVSGVAPKGLGI